MQAICFVIDASGHCRCVAACSVITFVKPRSSLSGRHLLKAQIYSMLVCLQRASSRVFKNLVIGAGPAGVAIASTLLDGGSTPTLWVDPHFQSGRLAHYTEVPSNTKVGLFLKYATTPASISGSSDQITQVFKVTDAPPWATAFSL